MPTVYEIVTRNIISNRPYRGLHVFMLASQGYGSPYWLTFNQAKQFRAHARQGEKSSLVSVWKFGEYSTEDRETGELENKTSVLLRYYRVFNIEQCEGLSALRGDDGKVVNPIETCEGVVKSMPNAPHIERDSRAFYRPIADTVGMPSRNLFEAAEPYYSTLFHELTHGTGHKSRVNRFEGERHRPSVWFRLLFPRGAGRRDGRGGIWSMRLRSFVRLASSSYRSMRV